MRVGTPQIEVDHQDLLADPAKGDGGREGAGGFAFALLGAGEHQAARQAMGRHQHERRAERREGFRHQALRIENLLLDRKTFLRSEEHTYELKSLMRLSYAVFCL